MSDDAGAGTVPRMRRCLAGGILAVALLTSGCGMVAPSNSEGELSASIGTAVTTTTTTAAPLPAPDESARVDSGALYRGLVEQVVPTGQPDAEPEEEPPPSPLCFAMETVIFQSTQMLLQEDLGAALERYRLAVASLDSMISTGSPEISTAAVAVRDRLVTTVEAPGAATSVDAFRSNVQAMVQSDFGALFDALFSTMAAECGANLSDPYVPSSEGVENITRP